MKKLTAVFIVMILLASLGACMPKENNAPSAPPSLLAPSQPHDTATPVEDTTPVSEEKRVSFVATGDNIIYTCTWIDARNHAKDDPNNEYDFKPIYKNVEAIINSTDISFINQETPMTGGANSAYPYFNSPQKLGRDLADIGFDVISIANNHMLDQGNSGLSATIDFLNTLDITLVGGYKNEDDFNNIRVIEKNGIKIAFLAYTEWTNGIRPQADTPIVPYFNEETIRRQTAAAREIADFVIVSMHWGDEYTQVQNANQEKYAKLLSECEVDVVLGSHSHSLQPIVELDRPSGQKTLVIYSLGNFLNAMDRPVNMVGGMLSFDIVKSEGFATRAENITLIPIVCHFGPSWYNSALYPLVSYTEELAKEHYVDLTLSKLRGFVTGVIDAKYLPDYLK